MWGAGVILLAVALGLSICFTLLIRSCGPMWSISTACCPGSASCRKPVGFHVLQNLGGAGLVAVRLFQHLPDSARLGDTHGGRGDGGAVHAKPRPALVAARGDL